MTHTFRQKYLMLSLLALFITGCTAVTQTPTSTPAASFMPTESLTPTPTATTTPIPTPAYTPLPASGGPTLLLQTDNDHYQIIDFGLGITYDFFPPEEDVEYRLAGNISPDRSQMLFINEAEGAQVVELSSGVVRMAFEFPISDFAPDQAVETIQALLPDLSYTDEMLVNAVRSAFQESLQNITWFQDSDHLLMALPAAETDTYLTQTDLKTGESRQLENEPGFVQAFYMSPNKDYILLKKSYLFEANVWEDDMYYLIDLTGDKVTPVTMPEDVDNPSLSWFDQDRIRIIHKTGISGSEGYSILDIHTMETTVLIPGLFTTIWKMGDGITVFTLGGQEEEAQIERFSMEGEQITAQSLPEGCSRLFIVGKQTLVNCETESILLDENLSQQSFGDPIAKLKSTSLGIIIITRSNGFFLYDESLTNFQSLELVGEPLEILWLPDSSGFLYRTVGVIYHYDFLTRSSRLLMESNLFSDYRNLNAVWVDIN